jgi:hypothetical protein
MDIWAKKINLHCGHLSDNISGHLSDTISIYPKIYVDNWMILTTSTYTHMQSITWVCFIRFRYYLSCCLGNRNMFIVTTCQLLLHYILIMDYSLILLLSMWIVNWQPWKYWRKYSEMSGSNVTDFILPRQIQKVGLSQEYKRSKSEIGMVPWNQHFPQNVGRVLTCYWNSKPLTISGAWTQYFQNPGWKRITF